MDCARVRSQSKRNDPSPKSDSGRRRMLNKKSRSSGSVSLMKDGFGDGIDGNGVVVVVVVLRQLKTRPETKMGIIT